MFKIPFLDLKSGYVELKEEIDSAINRVLSSGLYIGGAEVEAFEAEFSSYCGVRHTISVGNGLDALRLALTAMDVGPGDEVIVPSHTYIATWLAVHQTGATLVPVEPDVRTYNIDTSKIENAVSEKTKVILPVHLYGQPANLDPILEVAKKHRLLVLEDAAQAHGARYRGTRLGGNGDAVAWSFYPGKNLGAIGDGGAVTTNSDDFARKLQLLRNYGSRKKYVHEIKGFNSRLDPIQAAVLREKLKRLDLWNDRRREIASLYLNTLIGQSLTLPFVPDWAEPVWHLFVTRHPRRDEVRELLNKAGVETLIHYPAAPYQQPAFKESIRDVENLAASTELARSVFSLPLGPHMGLKNAHEVCVLFNKVVGEISVQ